MILLAWSRRLASVSTSIRGPVEVTVTPASAVGGTFIHVLVGSEG